MEHRREGEGGKWQKESLTPVCMLNGGTVFYYNNVPKQRNETDSEVRAKQQQSTVYVLVRTAFILRSFGSVLPFVSFLSRHHLRMSHTPRKRRRRRSGHQIMVVELTLPILSLSLSLRRTSKLHFIDIVNYLTVLGERRGEEGEEWVDGWIDRWGNKIPVKGRKGECGLETPATSDHVSYFSRLAWTEGKTEEGLWRRRP